MLIRLSRVDISKILLMPEVEEEQQQEQEQEEKCKKHFNKFAIKRGRTEVFLNYSIITTKV